MNFFRGITGPDEIGGPTQVIILPSPNSSTKKSANLPATYFLFFDAVVNWKRFSSAALCCVRQLIIPGELKFKDVIFLVIKSVLLRLLFCS